MSESKTVTVKYPAGHSYTYPWELTEYFCPCCGKRDVVWKCNDGGDYYVGEQYVCASCGASMYLDGTRSGDPDDQIKQVLEQLRKE